jgi:hypothetical protein
MPTDHTFLGGLKPMARVLGQHQDDQNAWDQHLEAEVVVILDRQWEDQMLRLQLE